MGQEDILKLLDKKPRLTTREIAEELGMTIQHASRILYEMIDRDILADKPTEQELLKIKCKYPHIVHCVERIRVFEVINENED